jgi:hypothetical protein
LLVIQRVSDAAATADRRLAAKRDHRGHQQRRTRRDERERRQLSGREAVPASVQDREHRPDEARDADDEGEGGPERRPCEG